VLYIIEKLNFEVALDNAKATILESRGGPRSQKAQNARGRLLRHYHLD